MAQPLPVQAQRGRDLKPLWLLASILGITLLHYNTSTHYLLLHEIYQRLYYIPIIYAAYSYGLRGGLAAAVLSTLIYLPHLAQHADNRVYAINQYAETVLFFVVGVVTGLLAGKEQRERRRYEQTAAELQSAYDELRSTVDQLLLADRHASLGQMSAAIVHEIRNPLGAIRGAAEALESIVPHEHEKAEFLTIIKQEVERLNGLVTDFLNFARPRLPELLPTPPHEIIDAVVKLAKKQAEQAQVKIITEVAEALPFVRLDAEQMKQVLLNLILNAIEAMPDGGQLMISARQREQVLRLAVRDTGKGIDPTVREKLFSPFVTTKTRGTGLGLAIAHRLVTQHGGQIEAIAGEDGGALIEIRLPLNR
ncbi:MAG: sensor histidine kinase [Blastocatellia bacterium]|nr:sensor histidine kinase [Blastocatellia bacterium]